MTTDNQLSHIATLPIYVEEACLRFRVTKAHCIGHGGRDQTKKRPTTTLGGDLSKQPTVPRKNLNKFKCTSSWWCYHHVFEGSIAPKPLWPSIHILEIYMNAYISVMVVLNPQHLLKHRHDFSHLWVFLKALALWQERWNPSLQPWRQYIESPQAIGTGDLLGRDSSSFLTTLRSPCDLFSAYKYGLQSRVRLTFVGFV